MSHSGTYTYNQIQTLHSNAHTLTLSRTIAFRIHTLCSQARQRGVSLHHTLGRTHIHHRYIASTHQRGKHTHYLQNTYIRDTSCHILLHEENILTTYKTHTSEIHHAIYSYTRKTYSLPTKHIHQRYIMPYTRPGGSLRHTLRNTYIRDTIHIVLHGEHILTTYTTDPSEIHHAIYSSKKDHFVTHSQTHTPEILCIYSSTGTQPTPSQESSGNKHTHILGNNIKHTHLLTLLHNENTVTHAKHIPHRYRQSIH